MTRERIFVQIASYRDPECPWTVRDIYEKAKHPARIFVGIYNQVDPERDKECFSQAYPFPDHVRETIVPATASKGVCWARHHAEKLYGGEEYLLMIDSHTRFIPDWDDVFIQELKLCPSRKPVLSNYPAAYTPPDRVNVTESAIVMVARPFNRLGDLRFDSKILKKPSEKPLRGAFVGACFLFAKAELMKEVPYDPHMYFAQEEIILSARLFTHGWDVFSPRANLLYHMYLELGSARRRRLHWEDHKDWLKMWWLGRRRCEYLLTGKTDDKSGQALVDIEKYGLGRARTLDEFEAFVDIDFAAKEASQKAREGTFIKDIELYA